MATTELKLQKPRVRVQPTKDGLQNVYSGLGTANSKSGNNNWVLNNLHNGPTVDIIYRESWLAQRICSIPAEDATRQWRIFNGEYSEDIERVENEFDIQTKVAEAKTFARAYGGACILMVTGQDLEKPLDFNAIKKGDKPRFIVLDRWDLQPSQLNTLNPMEENYLLPEYYTVTGGSQRIHYSHVVRFAGVKLSRRLAQLEHGWGDSELRRVLQDMNMTTAAFMGVGEMLHEANVDVIRRDGLSNELTTGEENNIIKRYQYFQLMKSSFGLSLLDGSEDLERLTLQLSGVAQSMEQLITWISGASQIPVSRLFGKSAKGMNATGEGDEKVYYDRIKSIQTRELNEPLKHLDKVLVRCALGNVPNDCDFTWNPLSQLDDDEQANIDYTDSQTDAAYMDMRILKRSQVAKRLQKKDRYDITDEDIARIEKEEKEEEAMAKEEDDNFSLPGEENGEENKPEESNDE